MLQFDTHHHRVSKLNPNTVIIDSYLYDPTLEWTVQHLHQCTCGGKRLKVLPVIYLKTYFTHGSELRAYIMPIVAATSQR